MSNELIFKKSITINAPPSDVWEALTNPVLTKKYMFNCEAISDWKEGSSLIWKGAEDGKIYVKGKIEKIIPQKLFRYTVISPEREDKPENYTTVTYELTQENGSTRLDVS